MRKINELKVKLIQYKNRIGLKNKDFTIISNNCWGGFVYQKFGLEYKTPFIGLFLFAPDYIKLLENFEELIFTDISFIDINKSKYINHIKNENKNPIYPVGVIGDDIEIHFLHYKSEKEALIKWNKRIKRINLNNMIIKFSDRDLCTRELIKKFDSLKFNNKICFVAKNYEEVKNCIVFNEFKNSDCVESEWLYYENYINIKKYINRLI